MPDQPLHITASLQVFRKRLGRAATIAFARAEVIRLAKRGGASSSDLPLVLDLERATGVAIAELGKAAVDWPTDV